MKHTVGIWLLIVGIAIHVAGNAKKAADQSNAGASPTNTDVVYYGATLALVVGLGLLWKRIK